MSYPLCFESQEQFDRWLAADNNCYHYTGKDLGRHTPICTDCTPTYQQTMRLQSRCEHTEIKFYKAGNAYRGGEFAPRGSKPRIEVEPKWEPVDGNETRNTKEPGQSDEPIISLNAGTRVSRGNK